MLTRYHNVPVKVGAAKASPWLSRYVVVEIPICPFSGFSSISEVQLSAVYFLATVTIVDATMLKRVYLHCSAVSALIGDVRSELGDVAGNCSHVLLSGVSTFCRTLGSAIVSCSSRRRVCFFCFLSHISPVDTSTVSTHRSKLR